MNSEPRLEPAPLEPLDESDGPAVRLSAEEFNTAVSAAVSAAFPARRRLDRRRIPFLLAAAALGITGVAFALYFGRLQRSSPSPTVLASVSSAGLTQPSASGGSNDVQQQPPPAASTETSANPPEIERAKSAGPTNAADMLKAANQLRRQARWADAERVYSQVATTYASVAQGPVAALAAASLRLEHLRDPQGALRLYQSATRASSLAAEAELGIADCYHALGNRNAEVGALRLVVTDYPQALFHERAEARLKALEAARP